jgi:hypothetical protein
MKRSSGGSHDKFAPEGYLCEPANQMHWRRFVWPVGAVFGALAGMAVIYLGYDVLKDRTSPCESIFRQTSLEGHHHRGGAAPQ